MLKQRVITAFIMLLGFLAALFLLPEVGFAFIAAFVFLVGAWEWSNLSNFIRTPSRILVTFTYFIFGLLAGWYTDWGQNHDAMRSVLLVAGAWWAFSLFWIQGYPSSAALWKGSYVRTAMGVLVLIPAWLACLFLRDQVNGAWLILMIVFIVAAADIGAYFSGRTFGRRKLAPKVSPGKSWEGVFGGVLFAVVIGLLFNFMFGGDQWLVLLAILIPTALVSVVGDLLESMVKRYRGVKDSGHILPGHGGVLDRIDGLVAAVPVFTLFLILTSYRL